MRSGLACVCYATDGVTDLIVDGENGFVIPPGNVALLSERVLLLLRDEPLRLKMGRNARESISAEFDIDEMVRAQERLYEECSQPPLS